MIRMPGRSYSGPFQPLSDNEKVVCEYLEKHIVKLADQIGERNIWREHQLEEAARYIEETLEKLGYLVTKQEFEIRGITVRNIEAELIGSSRPEEIIVVGAHYDSVMGSPGANDNGSGVAAVLEIARLLAGTKPSRTIRFVAFVNEEPPFFQTEEMGSLIYTSQARQRKERITAMMAIETIGYYSDAAESQHYPFPFSFFYPSTGNFIGFVGNIASRNLVHQAIASFRRHTAFPSEGVAAPGWITGISWSDQWSFWKEGYPAFMVTDTALFRYQYYHSREDTPDKIEYDHMARVVAGLSRIAADIAQN